jgi:hypothetical protein
MRRVLLSLALLLTIGAGSASATLAIDSQEASGAGARSTSSPLTWTFTNTAGTVLYCGFVVTSSSGGTSTFTSASYNSVSMTALGAGQNWATNASKAKWFRLLSPATGANTVSLTWSGGSNPAALGGCISFTGNDTSTPEGSEVKATGTGTAVDSGAVTSTSGNIIISVGGSGTTGATGSFTPTSPDVKTFFKAGSSTTSGDNLWGSTFTSSGASHNMKWTIPSDQWGIVAFEIKAAAGAAGCTDSHMLGVLRCDEAPR